MLSCYLLNTAWAEVDAVMLSTEHTAWAELDAVISQFKIAGSTEGLYCNQSV